MGIRLILLVLVNILRGERDLIRGEETTSEEGVSYCCPFITVNVGGSNANLSGEYKLKVNTGFKPEDICIDGCIYTKKGSPFKEYCFIDGSGAGADVKCLVSAFNSFL
jgi:hypothetical protein